jgi:phage-related protein
MVHLNRWGLMNKIIWNKRTLKIVQYFPDSIKKELGYLLFKLQMGESLAMPHSKAMPSVGKGCFELRVKGEDGAYRVSYLFKIEHEIIVFHAFKKTTQKTPTKDIELGKKNLKDMI